MDQEDTKLRSGRRGFLKLGVGSVAGGAALAAGGLVSGTAKAAAPAKPDGGYAETDHVKSYYDTARF